MIFKSFLSKKIELRFYFITLLFFTIILMFFGSILRYRVNHKGGYGKIGQFAEKISEFPSLVKNSLDYLKDGNKAILMMDNNFPEISDGLKFSDANIKDSGFLLNSYYNLPLKRWVVDLFSINEKKIIHRWIPPIAKINAKYNLKQTNEDKLSHPLLLKNGSLVSFLSGCLIKIDSSSSLEWAVVDFFHHSIETDLEGNIYCCGNDFKSKYLNKFGIKWDNTITKFNSFGQLVFKKSILDILIENNYRALVFGTGPIDEVDGDNLHVNEIKPALFNSNYWKKRDLLISVRNKSTIFLYRPSTNKILWLKTGPWLNQHCPDFLDSNRISIFSNEVIDNINHQPEFANSGYNNLYIYNFKDETIDTSFSKAFINCKIRTDYEGRAKVLKNGDLFVDETNNGRYLRITKSKYLWEFVNKIDEKYISCARWGRYLTKVGPEKFNLSEN